MGSIFPRLVTREEPDFSADDRCYIMDPAPKEYYEWHINDQKDTALKKAKELRQYYQRLYKPKNNLICYCMRFDSIIKDSVYAFKKGYLDDIDMRQRTIEWDDIEKKKIASDWNKIETSLAEASKNDDPTRVLHAYSCAQWFTTLLNRDMAKNTYHQLNLYCTPLNCNVLARTQDGIQSLLSVLFHPKLEQYFVLAPLTVYRGSTITDKNFLTGYKENAVIITTTLLSTSEYRNVAEIFGNWDTVSVNDAEIRVLCKFNLHNHGNTALDMTSHSQFPEEKEILILPYVPFRILSSQNSGKKFEFELEEIDDARKIGISTENQGLLSNAGTFNPNYSTIRR